MSDKPDSSTPSVDDTTDASSTEGSTTDSSTTTTIIINDSSPVDRSSEPDAEASALALKLQGNEALAAKHFAQAMEYYSQALEYAPQNAVLHANRAAVCIQLEQYGLALQDADAAIAADPQYVKAYYRRASAHFCLQQFKAARKDYKQVLQLIKPTKDVRTKLKLVEKTIREQAFAKAIEAEQTAPASATFNVDSVTIPETYTGPRLEDESLFQTGLPRDFCTNCMDCFRNQGLIHKRYVALLLLTCIAKYQTESSLMRIPVTTKLTVCGDTHGQYYDVLHIFELNGLPSSTNPYLFNGDFVDRGSFSIEVICTLLLWKLHDPTCLYLTRGNHETKNMNKIYGFEGECKAKYDDKIFDLFLETFSWLPLAAVVQDSVFVVHGGISCDEFTLDQVDQIARGREPPESGLMSDLLWSDPQPFPGKSPSQRGVGFSFGPDICQAFLERNNLKLVVRSHQVKDEGYLVEHEGKTVTVFSAPNYCDRMGNKGAYIEFGPDMEPVYHQFEAVEHPNVQPMAYAPGMGGMF